MFSVSNSQIKLEIKFEAIEMADHMVVTGDIRLRSVSDFYALLQFSFTRVITASRGDSNVPGYKVKCNDFKPLAASDTVESSLDSALSKQFSNASSLQSFTLTYLIFVVVEM